MPSSAFYAYFEHVLRCSKQVIQTETLPKKGLKIESFLQKMQVFFAFFSETIVQSH